MRVGDRVQLEDGRLGRITNMRKNLNHRGGRAFYGDWIAVVRLDDGTKVAKYEHQLKGLPGYADLTLRCPTCGRRADMCFEHGDEWKKRPA